MFIPIRVATITSVPPAAVSLPRKNEPARASFAWIGISAIFQPSRNDVGMKEEVPPSAPPKPAEPPIMINCFLRVGLNDLPDTKNFSAGSPLKDSLSALTTRSSI